MKKVNVTKNGGLKNPSFFVEYILIFLAFAVLIGWFFRGALFTGSIFAERDLSRYYYPLRFFAVSCMKSGIFPLWNPYIFCGNPLFASLQSCVLYPPSIIYYLGDFAKTFNIFIVTHFFLAGLFTYIFMRQMRYSIFAAFLSGATFALSGYMVSVVNLLTTLSAVTWFPLAMLFYYKMIKGANNVDSVILGLIFTIMFLGGEPSILYMTIVLFFCGSVYFTIEAVLERRGGSRPAPTCYLKGILLSIVVFLGLSAFQILPLAEFLKFSSRERINFNVASIWNLPFQDLPAVVWPFFHDMYKLFMNYWVRQSWLDNYYAGVLVLLLFIWSALFDKSKKARAILVMGLVGLAVSLGKDTFIFLLMHKFLPGFKAVRYSIRFFFIPAFALCALAGIGLDSYGRLIKSDEKYKKFAFFMFALAFFSSVLFMALNYYEPYFSGLMKYFLKKFVSGMPGMPMFYVQDVFNGAALAKFINVSILNLKRACLLVVFFGSLFYLGSKKGVRPQIFIVPALLFLAVADVFQVNGGYNPLYDIKKFITPPSNVAYLMKEQKESPLFRICSSPQTAREHSYVPEADFAKGMEGSKNRFMTNTMVIFGIYDVNMYGSVYNQRNSEFLNAIMEKKSENLEKLLALLNVRFVASSKDPKATGFKLANKSDVANIYETKSYLPRAFLAGNPVVIKDKEKLLERMKNGEFDPANDVFLEEYVSVPPVAIVNLRAVVTEQCSVTTYKPNKITIEATVVGKPKFLILSDTYYPGWKALVDGKYRKIYRADYILRAVYLDPGSHKVKFIYDPASFKIGLFITCACLIILTFILFNNIIKNRL